MLDTPERRDPEQTFRDPDEKAMACAITITTQVGSNRSIVVQTYVDRDQEIGLFHEVMDKLNKVVDRQEAKLQLESMEADHARRQKTLNHLAEDFDRIEERAKQAFDDRGKKGAFRLSEAELNQKNQARANIGRLREEINILEVDILKAKGVIADVD